MKLVFVACVCDYINSDGTVLHVKRKLLHIQLYIGSA
jgi:hypothetical protein